MTNLTTLCSCIVCHEERSARGIHSHYLTKHTIEGNDRAKRSGKLGRQKQINEYQIKPKIVELPKFICLVCNIPTYNSKFCSRKCSAIFHMQKRKIDDYQLQQDQKDKISNSLIIYFNSKPKYSKLVYNTCKVCSKIFSWSCNRKTCSDECYRKNLSNTAKANPKMGGNKNTRAFGWYDSPIAGKVWLESSYEHKIALELDKYKINWIRPKGMPYILNDKHKTYNADFYLIEFDVYLDPKNEYLITQDMPKINAAIEQNNVNIQVLTKHQLTWEEILKVL